MLASSHPVLFHANDWESFAVGQWNSEIFECDVATGLVERNAGEGRGHFESGKLRCQGGIFTSFENCCANSTSSPGRMHEEGTNLGGVLLRIQKGSLAAGPLIATVECLALAPAAAAYQERRCGTFHFRHEVGSVLDELGVHAIDRRESAFDLGGSVVLRLQATHGSLDENPQCSNVGRCCLANTD